MSLSVTSFHTSSLGLFGTGRVYPRSEETEEGEKLAQKNPRGRNKKEAKAIGEKKRVMTGKREDRQERR
jgi:hypothetical protein